MELNSNKDIQNRIWTIPVQSDQNSQIYPSTVNYGTKRTFPYVGLSHSMNFLNNNISTPPNEYNNINVISDYKNTNSIINSIPPHANYYNSSLNPHHQNKKTFSRQKQIYGENVLKTTYVVPTKKPMNILPIKYFHNNVITSNQIFNNNYFTDVTKIAPPRDNYNNEKNLTKTQIKQQPFKEYYTSITNVIPDTDIKLTSKRTVSPTISKINPNFTHTSFITSAQTPINNFMPEPVLNNPPITTNVIQATPVTIDTPIIKIDSIPYQTEEYKTTNYQNKNKSQTISYELKKEDSNANNININSNHLINEYLEKPPENITITTNSQIIYEDKKRNENINEEYYINSPDSEKPFEEIYHSYIPKSPILERRIDFFSPIQSPLSNFETLSQNEESTLYKLENELFNLETENESYKKQLQELEKYKFESSETKVSRKEKDKDKLSPLKEAFEEIVSIKAQLAELNELKLKIKELENLKIQVEQITSNKNKKKDIKSLGRLDKKRKNN